MSNISQRFVTPSDLECALFGSLAGIQDTSVGKSGYAFPGHFCFYSIFTAQGTISAGEFVMQDQTQTPGGIDVIQRNNASRHAAGVALHDASSGDKIKVAWSGFVDAQCVSNRTAIGDYMMLDATTLYQCTSSYGASVYSVGTSASRAGTGGYLSGWVRLNLVISTR